MFTYSQNLLHRGVMLPAYKAGLSRQDSGKNSRLHTMQARYPLMKGLPDSLIFYCHGFFDTSKIGNVRRDIFRNQLLQG